MNITNVFNNTTKVKLKQELVVIKDVYYLKTFIFNVKQNEWQSYHLIQLDKDCLSSIPSVDVSYDLFDWKQ